MSITAIDGVIQPRECRIKFRIEGSYGSHRATTHLNGIVVGLTNASPAPPDNTATLVVSRTLPGDVGHRQVYLDLDGTRVATLLDGQTFTCEIAAGPHRLRFDNTLQKKTMEFTAEAGEYVEYRLANTAGRLGLPFLALLGVAPLFLKIERVPK